MSMSVSYYVGPYLKVELKQDVAKSLLKNERLYELRGELDGSLKYFGANVKIDGIERRLRLDGDSTEVIDLGGNLTSKEMCLMHEQFCEEIDHILLHDEVKFVDVLWGIVPGYF